jgi:tryptophan synthase alpha subunit
MTLNRIKQVFDNLRNKKQKAFVSFLTAGDPNYKT